MDRNNLCKDKILAWFQREIDNLIGEGYDSFSGMTERTLIKVEAHPSKDLLAWIFAVGNSARSIA